MGRYASQAIQKLEQGYPNGTNKIIKLICLFVTSQDA